MNIPKELANVQLVGHKGVLIKLRKYESITTKRESGLEDVLYERYHTEGGKKSTKISGKEYQPVGVVVAISPQSKKYIKETWEGVTLQPGQIVWINQHSVSGENEFLIERSKAVTGNKGFIAVHPNSIEAIEDTEIITLNYESDETKESGTD